MSDMFKNDFEDESEVSETTEFLEDSAEQEEAGDNFQENDGWDDTEDEMTEQDDIWDQEPRQKLYDDMDNAFRDQDQIPVNQQYNQTQDVHQDEYPDVKPVRKKKGGGEFIAVILVVFMAVAVVFCTKLFGDKQKDPNQLNHVKTQVGAGNISNMAFLATSGDYTYYIEPSTYAICRFKDSPSDAEILSADPTNNPALFLTDIEGTLHYVSMKTGNLMRLVDGNNDEIVREGKHYYPTYVNHTLYYLNIDDYMIYSVSVDSGKFGEATPVTQNMAYWFSIYEDKLYYVGAMDSFLYAMPLDGSADPEQINTSLTSYINIADGYIYYMRYPDEAETVTPALCRVPVDDYSKEEVIVDNSYCIYNNYCDGYIYYMNYTPTETEEEAATAVYPLYCVKADGSEEPYQVSPDSAVYIHIADGYVYYITTSGDDMGSWKRLPVGEVDEDGTKAEKLPGQELLPSTDEPFALEDVLGEENIDENEEIEEVA